ncbi:T3SS effector HopA1 family protein [Bradyrhizobium sp. Y36]|uniref:T3SS effector HopA1 family protein n=1 Tax=Bradyrhizobium sp. Y36 TaxID=2035447 RepID=UPI001304513C|nr:T3SS effector HopA1 family protein [Bradyrhizobium sp. Y36]
MSMPAALSDDQRLDALLANLEIMSPVQFRVGGGPLMNATSVPRHATPLQSQNGARDGLTVQLRDALASVVYFVAYSRVYEGGPFDLEAQQWHLSHDASFCTGLRAHNPTIARSEPGWKVFQLEQNGAIHVQKGESATMLQQGRYAFPGGYARIPMIGEFVEIPVVPDSLTEQAGSYFAFGDTIASDYDFARLTRFYFNAAADEASWLLTTVGTLFNRYLIPYRFKCSVDPAGYNRTDSVVVYLARRFLPIALRLLAPLRDEIAARLRPGTPLFSAPLLDGMGGADDPASGESFGQSRSRLIADGIVDAWEAGHADPAGRRAAVEARFSTRGISLQHPYLAQGLVDLYGWPAVRGAT